MAEKKSKGYKLRVVGPATNSNATQILRFKREGNKKDVDLVPGQVLTVSDDKGDLTLQEGKKLQSTTTWKFKREE